VSAYQIRSDYHSIINTFVNNLRNSGIENINIFLALNTDSPELKSKNNLEFQIIFDESDIYQAHTTTLTKFVEFFDFDQSNEFSKNVLLICTFME
jgi:hypothetical protein